MALVVVLGLACVYVVSGSLWISTTSLTEADVLENDVINENWAFAPGFSSSEIDLSNYERFWVWSDLDQQSVAVSMSYKVKSSFRAVLRNTEPVYEDFGTEAEIYLDLANAESPEYFYVWFECLKESTHHLQITVQNMIDNQSFTLHFQKNCYTTTRSDLQVSVNGMPVFVGGELVDTSWTDGSHIEGSFITEIAFRIEEGAQLLTLHDIQSPIHVQYKGIESEKHIIGESGMRIFLLYYCKEDGTFDISFVLDLPPYNRHVLKWRRRCGDSEINSSLISVGTSPFEQNVIKNGAIVEKFNRFSLSDMTDVMTFYVSSKKDFYLKMYDPILTTNLNIMRPILIGRYDSPPYVITNEPFHFTIKFRCLNKGQSDFNITMAFAEEFLVEFGFKKVCRRPLVTEITGWYTPANVLWFVTFVCTVAAGIRFTLHWKGIIKLE